MCVSCGACVAAAPDGSMRMILDKSRGIYVPRILDSSRVTGRGVEFAVCPGKGMPIREMARQLFGDDLHVTFELGRYRTAIAAHSNNPDITHNASSGGVMTDIAAYLIERGYVRGATVSTFVYGPPGPRTHPIVARGLDDLIKGQGSKYCPTTTNLLVHECLQEGGRYVFQGTPCQVGALRLAMRENPKLAELFPYTMANFCGGYRDFRELDDLVRRNGLDPMQVTYFRFRGGGQPGSMLACSRDGRTATEPYPDYGRRARIPKQKRCVFCVDATGELADFACGDAWVDRFVKGRVPWSIILTRSAFAQEVVENMTAEGRLVTAEISHEEIMYSQRSNLDSKKFRQRKRMAVCGLTGMVMPRWDVDLPNQTGSYWQEIRVLLGKLRSWIRHRPELGRRRDRRAR